MILKKLIPASDNGVSLEDCKPIVTIARAVRIDTKQTKTEDLDHADQLSENQRTV